MLSVAQSAELLNVSPARVRALVAEGSLPAEKVGRAWVLREQDVARRLEEKPGPGRPSKAVSKRGDSTLSKDDRDELHRLFTACKEALGTCPSAADIERARSAEEAGFMVAAADYFLQQKQRDVIRQGLF